MLVICAVSMKMEPALTEGQLRRLPKIHNFARCGNVVNGRGLYVGQLDSDDVQPILTALAAAEKEPVICDVWNVKGIRYGYEPVETDGGSIIRPVDGVLPFDRNEAEYAVYMQPHLGIAPPAHSTAGFPAWDERDG